jgi:glutamine cyclotransferase
VRRKAGLVVVLGCAIALGAFVFREAILARLDRAAQPISTLPRIVYRETASYPHDADAYTQGLLFDKGVFYESTGLYGRSTLRRVDPVTGKVLAVRRLAREYFGEGLALEDGKLYQLTWKSGTGFVYDRDLLRMQGLFHYAGEGWGLTFDGMHLVRSDGTSVLYFHDPESFSVVRTIRVLGPEGPVERLNELEFARGFIYANVWKTDSILRISPETGEVLGQIDLSTLTSETKLDGAGVANGIAYDETRNRFFVTGKRWPRIFEIELLE